MPQIVMLDTVETKHLPDSTVSETDGSTLSLGSLPEAATATTAGTPDWCTGFGNSPSDINSGPLLRLMNSPDMVNSFPNPYHEDIAFLGEWSKNEQRSDRSTRSESMGFEADLPRLDQIMAPPAPVSPLTPVSGDRNLTLSAQGKQPIPRLHFQITEMQPVGFRTWPTDGLWLPTRPISLPCSRPKLTSSAQGEQPTSYLVSMSATWYEPQKRLSHEQWLPSRSHTSVFYGSSHTMLTGRLPVRLPWQTSPRHKKPPWLKDSPAGMPAIYPLLELWRLWKRLPQRRKPPWRTQSGLYRHVAP